MAWKCGGWKVSVEIMATVPLVWHEDRIFAPCPHSGSCFQTRKLRRFQTLVAGRPIATPYTSGDPELSSALVAASKRMEIIPYPPLAARRRRSDATDIDRWAFHLPGRR